MGKHKSYCEGDCTQCNSINIIPSAQRPCYDDKFKLPQASDQMRFKKNGKTNIVATGVVGRCSHGSNSSDEGKYLWEKNFKTVAPYQGKEYIYVIQEALSKMDKFMTIDSEEFYIKFMRRMKIIAKEILIQNESETNRE